MASLECNYFWNKTWYEIFYFHVTRRAICLYYYKNNKLGEIDFLIENQGEVIPIEVKSGKSYKRHNALDNLLSSDLDIKKGYIFTNNNIEVDGNKIYLPIYMVMFFKRDEVKSMKYKIDLSDLK